MKQVYISGALTNTPNPARTKRFYEDIGRLLDRMGYQAYVPHLHTDPVKNPDITPAEVFWRDKATVRSSDLVIAYVGRPSLGVGMEIAYAEDRGIPLIIMYERDQVVSRFPRGVPTIVKSIEFSSYEEALGELETFLRRSVAKGGPRVRLISYSGAETDHSVT